MTPRRLAFECAALGAYIATVAWIAILIISQWRAH